MKVLVNGAYGFIGTNIIKRINEDFVPCGRADDIGSLMRGVDVVIQLAPNTSDVIDVMKEHSVHKIVYISTGGCIIDNKPINDYGRKKLEDEQLIKQSGLDYVILRPSNVYGEYHKHNWTGLLNIAIKNALNNEVLELRGNAVKDYLYVGDLCRVIQIVIYCINNSTYNVCSGHLYSSKEIVGMVTARLPLKVEYVNTYEDGYSLKQHFQGCYKTVEETIDGIIYYEQSCMK